MPVCDQVFASKLGLVYVERKRKQKLGKTKKRKIPGMIWNLKIMVSNEKLKKSNLLQDKGTWRKAAEPSGRGLQRALK